MFEYFEGHKIIDDYYKVIRTYEVGLTNFLLSRSVKMDSHFSILEYNKYYKGNPSLLLVGNYIQHGLPMIKKKIIFQNFNESDYDFLKSLNFQFDPNYYINKAIFYNKIIPNGNDLILDFNLLGEFKNGNDMC